MTSMASSMEIVFASLSQAELDDVEALVSFLPKLMGENELIGIAPAKMLGVGRGLLVLSDAHIWYVHKSLGRPRKAWDTEISKVESAHFLAGTLTIKRQGAFRRVFIAELVGDKLTEPFLNVLAGVVPLTKSALKTSRLSSDVEWHEEGSVSEEKVAAIDRALGSLSVFDARALSKGEIRELPNILWEDEMPIAVITGTYHKGNGILVVTDRRLIFIDKGLVGLTVEDIYFEDISSIESHQGWMMGSLTIYARGNKESIENVLKNNVRPFSDLLRNELAKSKKLNVDLTPQAQRASTTLDPAANIDALYKLAELHKMGALTDEQFEEQKAKLLM